MSAWYQLTTEEVINQLKTSPNGLKKEGIAALQEEYGKNELKEAKQKTKLAILLDQFKDIMIIILLVAVGI